MHKAGSHPLPPITVLHVITDLDRGGAETLLSRLVQSGDPARIRHHVVSLSNEGTLGPEIAAAGIPVTALGMTGARGLPATLFRLARLLRHVRPDVVSSWLYHADFMATLACLMAPKTPLIWNIRCADMDLSHYPRSTRIIRILLAHLSGIPDVVTANSEAGRRFHARLGYRPQRWELIANGFDTAVFRPDATARARLRTDLGLADTTPLAGIIARLDPMKDHATFLSAAAHVARSLPEAHFLLAGRGTDGEAIPDMARAAGLDPERLLCLGERRDIPAIMAALDVCVSSSITEGFSNTIGEAMACGVPCVVTDAGDSALIVGDTGRVVAVRDAAALGDAIADLLAMPPMDRQALGAAARARICEHFDKASMIACFESCYGSTISSVAD